MGFCITALIFSANSHNATDESLLVRLFIMYYDRDDKEKVKQNKQLFEEKINAVIQNPIGFELLGYICSKYKMQDLVKQVNQVSKTLYRICVREKIELQDSRRFFTYALIYIGLKIWIEFACFIHNYDRQKIFPIAMKNLNIKSYVNDVLKPIEGMAQVEIEESRLYIFLSWFEGWKEKKEGQDLIDKSWSETRQEYRVTYTVLIEFNKWSYQSGYGNYKSLSDLGRDVDNTWGVTNASYAGRWIGSRTVKSVAIPKAEDMKLDTVIQK